MILRVKNWSEFQHYKDRNPTWIKLHKKLLDDFAFHRLPLASRALAPMIWLLASEASDGVIDSSYAEIAFRIHVTEDDLCAAIKPLIDNGFLILEQNASNALAEQEQVSIPEKEGETETQEKNSVLRTAPGGALKAEVLRPLDLDKAFWETGRAYLTANHVPPERAGGLLGKWRKNHGREAVVAALARAEAESPSEVVSFIEGCLRVNGHGQRAGPATGMVEGFAAAAADRLRARE